jgi:hypothetical protein
MNVYADTISPAPGLLVAEGPKSANSRGAFAKIGVVGFANFQGQTLHTINPRD